MQPIQPAAVVSRIWEIYSDQFGVLFGTAVALYALQFVIYLLLPGAAGFALVVLFWAVAIVYQGMVVELVRASRTGAGTTRWASSCAQSSPCSGHWLLSPSC